MMHVFNILWVVIVIWLLIEFFNTRKARTREKFNFSNGSNFKKD